MKRDSIACVRLRLHYRDSGTCVAISRDATNAALGVTALLFGLPVLVLMFLVPLLTWDLPGLVLRHLTSSPEFAGAKIYRGQQAVYVINRTRFVLVSLGKLLVAAFLVFNALLLLNRFVLLPLDFDPTERFMSLTLSSIMSSIAGYLVVTAAPGLFGFFPGKLVAVICAAVSLATVAFAGPAMWREYYILVAEPRLFQEYLANRQNATKYEWNVPEQLRRPDFYIENVTMRSCHDVRALIERWHQADPAWESVLAKANSMIKRYEKQVQEEEKVNGPGVRIQ